MSGNISGDEAENLDGLYSGGSRGRLDPPLVSVIVICYNHARFIEKCLHSILQQTYTRLEFIVVENASTDDSRDVIDRFVKANGHHMPIMPIMPIFSTYNGREMGAMLQGFAVATGRYICFVDGDDWLLPRCIETHIKVHLASRIAVGVTSVDMYQSFDNDIVVGTGKRIAQFVMSKRGQPFDFCRMENLGAFEFAAPAGEWDLSKDELHLVPPSMAHEWHWSPTSGLCFRRELIELLFNPEPTLRDGVDGYLVRGTCCLTGGIVIDRSLAVYRMHGNNLFGTHPALENLLQFKGEQNAGLNTNICQAVVTCFYEQMSELSQKLEVADLYIQAINSLSKVCLNENAGIYSSYTVRFLVENKSKISECFGAETYRRWLRKFMSIRDYVTVAFPRKPSAS